MEIIAPAAGRSFPFGRFGTLSLPFRHRDAAADLLALLDRLEIGTFKGMEISEGGTAYGVKAITRAHTLVVQGDRDALYLGRQSGSHAHSSLWIVPNAGHGPILGGRWPEFVQTALAFLSRR